MVDVNFPELKRIIDFKVDDHIRGWEIADEIGTMAARNCGRSFDAASSVIQIYSVQTKRILNLDISLRDNGIRSGDQLIFI